MRTALHRISRNLELALSCAEVEGGAESTEVVVLVDALDPDAFAVDENTFVWGERYRADAEAGFVRVDSLAP